MCIDIPASAPGSTRRGFLTGLGVTAAAGATYLAARPASAAASPTIPPGRSRTRIVPLGTAGGPIYQGSGRNGTSTAVVVGERVYIVDLGLGSLQQLAASGLAASPTLPSSLAHVSGVFFTHLHSDHTADWPAMFATSPSNINGRTGPAIRVYGPGSRGGLPRVYPPSRPEPAVISPEDPTPGITAMTGYLTKAFAQDLNDRIRDNNAPPAPSLFELHDIDISTIWAVDPEGVPPRMDPFPIWEDGDVKITATLVDHRPTAPAFAYRFDTPDGSIVVSGDTTVSENLIALAEDADYLVHEVIDAAWVDEIAASVPEPIRDALRQHLIASHTTIEQVGKDVGERAGAKNLVLTHLAPSDNPDGRWMQARRGYSGKVIVARELVEIPVSKRRS